MDPQNVMNVPNWNEGFGNLWWITGLLIYVEKKCNTGIWEFWCAGRWERCLSAVDFTIWRSRVNKLRIRMHRYSHWHRTQASSTLFRSSTSAVLASSPRLRLDEFHSLEVRSCHSTSLFFFNFPLHIYYLYESRAVAVARGQKLRKKPARALSHL